MRAHCKSVTPPREITAYPVTHYPQPTFKGKGGFPNIDCLHESRLSFNLENPEWRRVYPWGTSPRLNQPGEGHVHTHNQHVLPTEYVVMSHDKQPCWIVNYTKALWRVPRSSFRDERPLGPSFGLAVHTNGLLSAALQGFDLRRLGILGLSIALHRPTWSVGKISYPWAQVG